MPKLPVTADPDPVFLTLCDYWHSLRGDRLYPQRADVRFASGHALLLDIAIYAHHAPDDIRYWFVGPNRVEMGATDPMGRNLLDMLPKAVAGPFGDGLHTLISHPAGAWIEAATGTARLRALNLPLGGVDGAPRFSVSVIRPDAELTAAGRRAAFFAEVSAIQLLPIDIGADVPIPPQLITG